MKEKSGPKMEKRLRAKVWKAFKTKADTGLDFAAFQRAYRGGFKRLRKHENIISGKKKNYGDHMGIQREIGQL